MQKVPLIINQSKLSIMYRVPSEKSRPGEYHITEFNPSGKRSCTCLGVHWFKIREQEHMKMCRHQKMTTMEKPERIYDGFQRLEIAIKNIRKPGRKMQVALANIVCQQPEHWKETAIHCEKCPLYPRICNIRKITIDHRGTLPMVWKAKSMIFHKNRKGAEKILMKIRTQSRKLK